jgi:hypothetical protein
MKTLQTHLFKSIEELRYQPLILAYGVGVDSTAVLVELRHRGIRPDAILFADTGSEKAETYAYLPVINAWLKAAGFPQVTVVKYQPQDFTRYPPYHSLGENCLTNGTLPSLAFGFKSCSLKWKVVPQNQWTDRWEPALQRWKSGGKVRKIIGYDATPKDMKRYAHAKGIEDPKYDYWYPLVDWNMDREACKAAIRNAGLPVPPKSACYFCPATPPQELLEHRKAYLRFIVAMEARAKPRLQGCMTATQLLEDYHHRHELWQKKMIACAPHKRKSLQSREPHLKRPGSGCAGLWRAKTKTRPAMMTDFIREHDLLPEAEIRHIQSSIAPIIVKTQAQYLAGQEYLQWHDFLEMFTQEDALNELAVDCIGCSRLDG